MYSKGPLLTPLFALFLWLMGASCVIIGCWWLAPGLGLIAFGSMVILLIDITSK